MSTKRIVAIKLPQQNQAVKYEISATTFGELKAELDGKVNFTGMQVVERMSKTVYELEQAILPTEDFALYLFTIKNKSGLDLNTADYNTLRAEGSRLNKEEGAGIDLNGSKEDIRGRIANFLGNQGVNDLRVEFENAKEAVIQIFEELYQKAREAGINMDDIVFVTFQKDIVEEYAQIAKQLQR